MFCYVSKARFGHTPNLSPITSAKSGSALQFDGTDFVRCNYAYVQESTESTGHPGYEQFDDKLVDRYVPPVYTVSEAWLLIQERRKQNG